MQSEEEELKKDDLSLDFLSPQFDPLKALTASPSEIQLPCPEVPPCDNLVMYGEVVKGTRKVYTELPEEKQATPPATPTPPPPPPSRPPVSKEEKFFSKTVVAFMKRSDLGPLKVLQTCWMASSPVRVCLRHCVGVRGMCEGVPLAFDKHMNLVLCNVVEYYQPFRTLGNGGLEGRKKKKKNKSPDSKDSSTVAKTKTNNIVGCCFVMDNLDTFQIRTLSILFVRGDNIVLMSPLK